MKNTVLNSIFSEETDLLITLDVGTCVKFNDGSQIIWIILSRDDISHQIRGFRFSTIYLLDKKFKKEHLTELASVCNISGGRLFHYDAE
jgi:hypothetical protein